MSDNKNKFEGAYREEIGAARLRKDSGGHYKACSPEEGLATC